MFLLLAVAGPAGAAKPDPAPPPAGIEFGTHELNDAAFPHVIPFATYPVTWGKFAAGDDIVILSVRGDRPHLEPGGTYLVEGTYTLKSMAAARLGLSVTAPSRDSPGARSRVQPESVAEIPRGAGRFALRKAMLHPGSFHVSFNPLHGGQSQGTIYFKEAEAVNATRGRRETR